MKVSIDQNLCIGCGLCSTTCEEVFDLKDDGKSYVIKPEGCETCDLYDVADSCPVGAITVED